VTETNQRIDLQERVISYNISNQISLPSHTLILNLKPIKTEEFLATYTKANDPFGREEFKLGVALAKDMAAMSPYFRKAVVYQSKLVVETALGTKPQDLLELYNEFALSYVYRSKLSDPRIDTDVYCVPNWDLVNFMRYFQMMWQAFVARTLGEIHGVASKRDRSEHHTEILAKVLELNSEALTNLPDGIRYGIAVNHQGNLSYDKPV